MSALWELLVEVQDMYWFGHFWPTVHDNSVLSFPGNPIMWTAILSDMSHRILKIYILAENINVTIRIILLYNFVDIRII